MKAKQIRFYRYNKRGTAYPYWQLRNPYCFRTLTQSMVWVEHKQNGYGKISEIKYVYVNTRNDVEKVNLWGRELVRKVFENSCFVTSMSEVFFFFSVKLSDTFSLTLSVTFSVTFSVNLSVTFSVTLSVTFSVTHCCAIKHFQVFFTNFRL